MIFNGSASAFLLAPNQPAVFIWVTEDGTVQGWNPGVNATTAIIKVDNSQVPNKENGAVYKGATIVEIDGKEFLLAANFRSGRIDVFNSQFQPAHIFERSFDDDEVPSDFAPFKYKALDRMSTSHTPNRMPPGMTRWAAHAFAPSS